MARSAKRSLAPSHHLCHHYIQRLDSTNQTFALTSFTSSPSSSLTAPFLPLLPQAISFPLATSACWPLSTHQARALLSTWWWSAPSDSSHSTALRPDQYSGPRTLSSSCPPPLFHMPILTHKYHQHPVKSVHMKVTGSRQVVVEETSRQEMEMEHAATSPLPLVGATAASTTWPRSAPGSHAHTYHQQPLSHVFHTLHLRKVHP